MGTGVGNTGGTGTQFMDNTNPGFASVTVNATALVITYYNGLTGAVTYTDVLTQRMLQPPSPPSPPSPPPTAASPSTVGAPPPVPPFTVSGSFSLSNVTVAPKPASVAAALASVLGIPAANIAINITAGATGRHLLQQSFVVTYVITVPAGFSAATVVSQITTASTAASPTSPLISALAANGVTGVAAIAPVAAPAIAGGPTPSSSMYSSAQHLRGTASLVAAVLLTMTALLVL